MFTCIGLVILQLGEVSSDSASNGSTDSTDGELVSDGSLSDVAVADDSKSRRRKKHKKEKKKKKKKKSQRGSKDTDRGKKKRRRYSRWVITEYSINAQFDALITF